jgi:N-ethylmaleimide reductase
MKAFEPIDIGPVTLSNRICMAPMTRNRADNEHEAPTELHQTYYSQRASAGLIISEGSPVSKTARGYIYTAGLFNDEQVDGWKEVLDKVHAEGGVMQAQLWHVGRVSHPFFHDGEKPPAPSAVKSESMAYTPDGFQETPIPRAVTAEEIREIINDFKTAAANAMEAGFDGVQIHGANGYLIEQFLHDSANHRTDSYGGSIENRARFLFDVLDAVTEEVGADRTSIRLSPSNLFNTDNDSNSQELYECVIGRLNDYGLAYLELVEALADVDEHPALVKDVIGHYGPLFDGPVMTNGNYDRKAALEVIETGKADMVSFAKLFLANPDLPKRFKENAPLNDPDSDTFYAQGKEGYTDYPFLEEMAESEI